MYNKHEEITKSARSCTLSVFIRAWNSFMAAGVYKAFKKFWKTEFGSTVASLL